MHIVLFIHILQQIIETLSKFCFVKSQIDCILTKASCK